MSKMTYLDYIQTLLPQSEWNDFADFYKQRLPKTIKIVTSKISPADFKNVVTQIWRVIKDIIIPDAQESQDGSDRLVVETWAWSKTLGQSFLHQWGYIYIQELSASLSAPLLGAKPGDLILDLCAAPGGKTVQLADTGAFVVANEPNNPRRKALIYNLNRTGMYNTAVLNLEGSRVGGMYPQFFDKVLVDAPCSGEGMSYKTGWPMSRNEWLIRSLARDQVKLLASAIDACKPGWTVVYSTCTLNTIENEEVIETIQQQYSDHIQLMFSKKYRPHRDHTGGFFVAKFKVSPEAAGNMKTQGIASLQWSLDISPRLQAQIREQLSLDFGITELPDHYLFLATPQSIYLTSADYTKIHGTISLDKIWIPVYDIARDGRFLPTHHLGNILGKYASHHVISLDTEQAQAYAEYKDLKVTEDYEKLENGFYLLNFQNTGYSLTKKTSEMIKNKML